MLLVCNCSTKHDYPANVIQNFMNSCQATSGGNQDCCSYLLDKIQRKYTYEEFSVIETKTTAGQTPPEFLEFVGKERAKYSKK